MLEHLVGIGVVCFEFSYDFLMKYCHFGKEHFGITGKKKTFTIKEYPSKFSVKGQNSM